MPTPGNKTLRILQKDIRHLWPEIFLTLALTLGFAATQHFMWPAYSSASSIDLYSNLATWMNILLPVGWWVLTARAVHDEPLVGDLQFWVTRPYGWPRLLAAKLLLIATFILLPFFLVQCFLLHQAGLHPLAVLPGLLFKLLLLFAFILLPLLALSTVTPSLTRMLLTFLAVILYAVFATYFGNLFSPANNPWAPSADGISWYIWMLIVLVPAIAATVTFLQYAHRRTPLSVTLLVALVAVSTIALFAEAQKHHTLSGYPPLASTDTPPIHIAFNPDPTLQTPYGHDRKPGEMGNPNGLDLTLPIIVSGIAPGHAVQVEGISATAQAFNFPPTHLDWKLSSQIYTPSATGSEQDRQFLFLKQFDYKSITLTLTYALADYTSDPPITVFSNGSGFDIPDNGHCTPSTLSPYLNCQYAIQSPSRTLVTYTLQQTCGTTSPADQPRHQWIGNDNRFSPGLSPVTSPFGFPTYEADTRPVPQYLGPHVAVHLCPGAPITFTRYHLATRHLLNVPLPPINPQLYSAPERL
jgi:hypothetical protein